MKTVHSKELTELVGYQAQPTPWFEVTQQQINQFAETTLDHQFIHVDPIKAAATPFGGTIAHGMLTLSMMAHFAESFAVRVADTVMGLNYGFDKVRFLTPVKVGARIRAHGTLSDVSEKAPGQYLLTYSVKVEIEGQESPALAANWLALLVTSSH